jgi:hypothetical protein
MNNKLKIGLIVDCERVSKYVYDLAEWANTTDTLSVSHLIIQERRARPNRRLGVFSTLLRNSPVGPATALLWKATTRLESSRVARVKAFNGYRKKYDVGKLVPGRICVKPIVSPSGFIHRFSDQDLARVREEGFDLLIRCGSGILKGDVLNSARLGVLSFHHGDNRTNRGGIAGFWEVYHRQPSTGFVVQRLTEELDGGDVILRGYIPTQDTHLLNATMLFKKSYFHLRSLLLQVARTGELPAVEAQYPYSGKLLRSPVFGELIVYLSRQVTRSVSERVRRALRYRERWGICFEKSCWRRAVMWRGTAIETPPGRFLADPFVVTRDGRTCVFAEDFVFATSKAHVSVFELSAGGARELGVAVKEDYHLSFPYLFEFDGSLFMCPESRAAKEVRIYECTEFPLKWKLACVAMKNVVAADTLIFPKEGLWWMLTGISRTEPHDCSELYLFWAKTPLSGEWKPHARNPILIDPQRARNGGLLRDGDELIRVAQNLHFASYGLSARLFKITRITPDEYAEELVSSITPDFFPGIYGTHHFHSDGVYSVWDFKKWERV